MAVVAGRAGAPALALLSEGVVPAGPLTEGPGIARGARALPAHRVTGAAVLTETLEPALLAPVTPRAAGLATLGAGVALVAGAGGGRAAGAVYAGQGAGGQAGRPGDCTVLPRLLPVARAAGAPVPHSAHRLLPPLGDEVGDLPGAGEAPGPAELRHLLRDGLEEGGVDGPLLHPGFVADGGVGSQDNGGGEE